MKDKQLIGIKYFVGIDVAKATFNYCLRYGGGKVLNGKVANNIESIKEFIQGLKKIPGFRLTYAIFGMEVTGVYGLILLKTLSKAKARIVLEPAMRIKNSLGIIRGKNDRLDAARITRYLIKNLQELKLWVPRRLVIDELSSLSTLRERMIRVNSILITPLNEDKDFIDETISDKNIELCAPTILQAEQLLKHIDQCITDIWKMDPVCNRLMQIMLSVGGIGSVTALAMLIHTNEFKSFTSARAFASYCGVAPFEHDSGTSVKKKPRVSHTANKKIKALLHNCVRSSLQHDDEIKAYYKRRVETDKKNKLSTWNAIKFKLICRVFACINGDRMFEKRYIPKPPIPK